MPKSAVPALSLLRFQSSCEGKEAHSSEAAARAADAFYRRDGRSLGLRMADGLEPYKCDFCPDWHLGHAQPTGRVA